MIVFTPRARKSKFKHSVGYLSTEFFRKIIHNGRWTKIFATKCQGSRWTKIFATKSQGGDGPKFSRPNVKVAMDQNFRTNIFATKFFATKIFAAKVYGDLNRYARQSFSYKRTRKPEQMRAPKIDGY